jgi:cytochrome c oxidase subunit III
MESRENPEYDEYQSFAFHPHNVLLMLTLFGITMLFLSLTAGFVYNRVQYDLPPIKTPWMFFFSTLILLAGSSTMIRARQAYLQDNTLRYQRTLQWTLALTILFLATQAYGWWQLFSQQIFLSSDNSAAYLYMLSGLHFAHVIAGIPFLAVFIRAARIHMKEPVSVLVYFSDPEKKLKLRLLTIYWHFLDGLWIYLVLFFLVNQFIF